MSRFGVIVPADRPTISAGSVDASVGTQLTAYSAAGAVWPAANRAIYIPFTVANIFTAQTMGLANGNAVSGNVDVGIYDGQGHRLVSAGSTAQAGTSVIQAFDIADTILLPGLYYLAVALDNGTGKTMACMDALPNPRAYGILSQSTAFALPASATFAAAQDAYIPLVTVNNRTVV